MDWFRMVPAVPAVVMVWGLACGVGGGTPDVDIATDVSTGTECLSSSQCDDGLPCTVDLCSRGWCSNDPLECDDGDDCTSDSCVEGKCRFNRIPNCCETDEDCDDGDPCTKNDRCSLEKQCVIAAPVSPCCRSDADCGDGDVCTVDTCQVNLLCGHVWKESPNLCCKDDKGCSDSDACTRDVCVMTDAIHGRCDHEILCCDLDSDCTDTPNLCMEGVCEVPEGGARKECSYEWSYGCCLSVDDCEDFPCRIASCAGNECAWDTVPGCCTSDADCPDPKDCLRCNNGENPTGACVLKNDAGCCDTVVFGEAFNVQGEWEFQKPAQYLEVSSGYSDAAAWYISTSQYHGSPSSLAFTDVETGSCRVEGFKSGGRAVSPTIPLMKTNNPVLSFWMWKFTDEIQSSKDVVSVYVKTADGNVEEVFSTKSHTKFVTGSGFEQFPAVGTIDLSSWSGQSVELIFEYDSVANQYVEDYSVFIDDIVVGGTCGV